MHRLTKNVALVALPAIVAAVSCGCSSTGSNSPNQYTSPSTVCAPTSVVINDQPSQSTSSVASMSQTQPAGMYSYEYYPAAEVYHDPARGLYFYQESGDWTTGYLAPSRDLHQGDMVVIPLSTDKPYQVHHSIASVFSADQMN